MLCANVVEDIVSTQAPNCSVAYFFCRDDEVLSLQAREIIGSLARQFLVQLPADAFNNIDQGIVATPPNTDQVVQLLLSTLPRNKHYFVLVDGLDECAYREAELVTETFHSLLQSTSHTFKILCSGRDDFVARASHVVQPNFRLRITPSNNGPEISKFIDLELAEVLQSGRLQLGDENIIISIQDALEVGAREM